MKTLILTFLLLAILSISLADKASLHSRMHSQSKTKVKSRVQSSLKSKNKSRAKASAKALAKAKSRAQLAAQLRLRAKVQAQESRDLDNPEIRFVEQEMQNKMGASAQAGLRRKRYVMDGRPCASAFVQDGVTYRDCTTNKNPDGKVDGKEWCYIAKASQQPNKAKWAQCKAILDYDRVRMRARELFMAHVVLLRRLTQEIIGQFVPTSETIRQIQYIRDRQPLVDDRINRCNASVVKIYANYKILIGIKDEWIKVDKEIARMRIVIEALKALAALDLYEPKDGEGLLGYESEGQGDGLRGLYFADEQFYGSPVTKIDETVNFFWNNEPPVPNMSKENFSIRWIGYLRVPKMGKYTFQVQTDDGHELKLNGQTIIKHFMGDQATSWFDAGDNNIDKRNPVDLHALKIKDTYRGAHGQRTGKYQDEGMSNPIQLNGGDKYKIQLSMFHSVHNEKLENGLSFAKLYWTSKDIITQIIGDQYLYTKSSPPVLKISNWDPSLCELAVMNENLNAFKEDKFWKLQDIPFIYQGSPMIRCIAKYKEPKIKISVTASITVYIAAYVGDNNKKVRNPIPSDFQDTKSVMSVMKVKRSPPPAAQEANKEGVEGGAEAPLVPVKAIESLRYKIFKKKLNKGKQEIDLIYPPGKAAQKVTNFIIFYTVDPAGVPESSCGGDEIELTSGDSPAFHSCKESSKKAGDGWGCKNALTGRMTDDRANMWSTDRTGIGSWINIKLKKQYQVTRIMIKNREKVFEHNKKIEVFFKTNSDANSATFDLPNSDEVKEFKLTTPMPANSIIITIKGVYSTRNNGGAFRLFGIPCVGPDDPVLQGDDPVVKPPNTDKNQVFKVGCDDTILGNENIAVLGLVQGDVLKVNCVENCEKALPKIYGVQKYSADSAICKAALHAGAITSKDKKGLVKVSIIAGTESYESEKRQGIKSYSKEGTDTAISFQEDKKTSPLEAVKVGMRVDCYNDKSDTWEPAVVKEKNILTESIVNVVATMEESGVEKKYTWPGDFIGYCGSRIKDRSCDADSIDPDKDASDQVKITFGQGKVEGYIQDLGVKYGKKGALEFGWNVDATKQLRHRKANGNPLLDDIVLFSPAKESKWCNGDTDFGISCSTQEWSIKVTPSRYQVKITAGDSENVARYNILVNGKPIIDKYLVANEFQTVIDEDCDAFGGKITVSAVCEKNCRYSWSRMAAIEIQKLSGPPKKKDDNKKADRLGCGLAFINGRCETGKDVQNCVWEKPTHPAIQFCDGQQEVVRVPSSYHCNQQHGWLKCIKTFYEEEEECAQACPGPCNKGKCSVKAYVPLNPKNKL